MNTPYIKIYVGGVLQNPIQGSYPSKKFSHFEGDTPIYWPNRKERRRVRYMTRRGNNRRPINKRGRRILTRVLSLFGLMKKLKLN